MVKASKSNAKTANSRRGKKRSKEKAKDPTVERKQSCGDAMLLKDFLETINSVFRNRIRTLFKSSMITTTFADWLRTLKKLNRKRREDAVAFIELYQLPADVAYELAFKVQQFTKQG